MMALGPAEEHPNTAQLPSQCFNALKFPQPEPPALSAGRSWMRTHGHTSPGSYSRDSPAWGTDLFPQNRFLQLSCPCTQQDTPRQHPSVPGAHRWSWAAPGDTAPTAARSVCGSERSLRRRPGSLSAHNTQEETQAPRGKTTCPRLLHVPGSAANLRMSVQASARSRPRSPLGFDPLESRGNGSRSVWCPSSTLPHPCTKGKTFPGAAHPGAMPPAL